MIGVAAVALAEGAILGVWWFRDPARALGGSPVLRGRNVAHRLGCFGCHGPDGTGGVSNPGARIGEVPGWAGGTFMMYNDSPGEIREWILDGVPRRLRDDAADEERRRGQLISMPSYRGRVGGGDLEDLVSYVQSVSAAFKPPDGSAAAEGRRLALENGCFGCHGPEGRGLSPNPGSLKGYIPAWDSDDYMELVTSPEEFHEWVAEGEIRRLRQDPAAAWFLDSQQIKMPPYRGVLDREAIERVRAYVEWVRARPRPWP